MSNYWTEQKISGSLQWYSIASDSTGQYLAAVIPSSIFTFTSGDYGVNWTPHVTDFGDQGWTSIASDSTGQYLAAVINGGKIYTSTDYGTTWSDANNSPSEAWLSIAMSSNGKYSAAVNGITNIYTSNWIH